VFGFPKAEAAKIALSTVRKYKAETGSNIKVIFNVFGDSDLRIYQSLFN
jgi:O-acetyl-ADP-ribose deacetylase (regulator of RNase III)